MHPGQLTVDEVIAEVERSSSHPGRTVERMDDPELKARIVEASNRVAASYSFAPLPEQADLSAYLAVIDAEVARLAELTGTPLHLLSDTEGSV